MKKVDVAFLIGRFQPFHNGHKELIQYGLAHAEKVIVLVGGSNNARSYKNTWTFQERKRMIECSFLAINEFLEPFINQNDQRVFVEPLPDVPGNDDAWLSNVDDAVNKYLPADGTLGVVGFKKDASR